MTQLRPLLEVVTPMPIVLIKVVCDYLSCCVHDRESVSYLYDTLYPFYTTLKAFEIFFNLKYRLNKKNKSFIRMVSKFPKTIFHDIGKLAEEFSIDLIEGEYTILIDDEGISVTFGEISEFHAGDRELKIQLEDYIKIVHVGEDLQEELKMIKLYSCVGCMGIKNEIEKIDNIIEKINLEVYPVSNLRDV